MEQMIPCAACSAPVSADEVAQGLAVKVSGRLLCPLCLDHLPSESKVLVNQMRALRGMAVTTYRFTSVRHPRLPLFTFTTANLVLAHRRKLVHGMDFDAPILPPAGSRPRLPSAAEAARGDRRGWLVVAIVGFVLVGGVAWMLLAGGSKPAAPPPAVPVAQRDPEPVVPLQPDAPTRTPASELTDLERRLRAHPEEAQAIADAVELLRDGLAPREIALRNRADGVLRDALTVVDAQRPRAQPTPPEPEPAPEPVAPPPAAPDPLMPDATPPPFIIAPSPEPDKPTPPAVPAAPEPPAQAQAAVAATVTVLWPKAAKPLIEAAGIPRSKEVPWPWPSGEAIHAAAMDTKIKPKRLAIELRLNGVAAAGGATIVVHPGKAERSQLNAAWSDGTTTLLALAIELSGLRWQAIAIPASGSEALDQTQLRLRLEDARELGDQRPFLVAGARTRLSGAPLPADHPPRIPLLLPPAFEAANGWTLFRSALRKLAGKPVEDRGFSFAKTKVLLPFADRGGLFRTLLPNANPGELPVAHADFPNALAGWPGEAMADLDRRPALAIGWRSQAWGGASDLTRRLDNLLNKMLTADKRLRRPALVPLLILGDCDLASAAERAAIDTLWLDQALRLGALGVPIIDLRSAQSEGSSEAVQRAAAALVADALRQLDWMLKL